MNNDDAERHAKALLVAVGKYQGNSFEQLELAPKAAESLADALEEGGYRLHHRALLDGGNQRKITPLVSEWFDKASAEDTLFFLWTGHGASEGDGHYLLTSDSPDKNFTMNNTFPSSELGRVVAKSPADKILVILDTCFSGDGASDIMERVAAAIATRLPREGRSRSVSIIASAHPLKKAREARLCNALKEVLTSPKVSRRWSDNDEHIDTNKLAVSLTQLLGEELIYKADGVLQKFIPNPRFRGTLPPFDVETRSRQLALLGNETHFLRASQGGELEAEAGCYFTGRQRLREELVCWMQTEGNGLAILTGPPGTGKSAVLGRLVVLSDQIHRALAISERGASEVGLGIPPPNSIDLAIHVKGKTLVDCVKAMAKGLKIGIAGFQESVVDGDDFIDRFLYAIQEKAARSPVVIVFDALDEAHEGQSRLIGTRLLTPLSRIPNVRVILGVRRNPDGRVLSSEEGRHDRLRNLFGKNAFILDLEDEPETEKDLADYVAKRLLDSKHKELPYKSIRSAANAVAKRADGSFLYARIVSRTLMDLDRLDGQLPASALEAFAEDITLRFQDSKHAVHALLRALAWGEGKGLSRWAWRRVSNVITPRSSEYSDDDIQWMLENAGAHIVESGENGQAVYGLAHQAFNEFFRTQDDEKSLNERISRAFTKGIKGESWLGVDDYLCRHLAGHAAKGGILEELIMSEPGFLAIAEPRELLLALREIRGQKGRKYASVYRRVVNQFAKIDPINRMAVLHLTACQEAPEIAESLSPPSSAPWKCRWARCSPSNLRMILPGHEGGTRTVTWGHLDGTPVVVSSGDDQTIRLWSPLTGEHVGNPLTHHPCEIRCVVWGEIDGAPVILSAGDDGRILLWNVRRGELIWQSVHDKGTTVCALAWTRSKDFLLVASADQNGLIRLWDAKTGNSIGAPIQAHAREVTAMASGELDNAHVLASAGTDGGLWLWNPDTRQCLGSPVLRRHSAPITALVWAKIGADSVLAFADADGAVRFWNANTKKLKGSPPWGRHTRSITSIAIGEIDDKAVLVSTDRGGSLRIWNARTAMPRGDLIGLAPDDVVVAWGGIDGEPVIISSGKGGDINLWDVGTCDLRSQPEFPDKFPILKWVQSGEETLVASAHSNGEIRRWSQSSGDPINPQLNYSTGGMAVAWGEIDGEAMIVSGSWDGYACVTAPFKDEKEKQFTVDVLGVSALSVNKVGKRSIIAWGGWLGKVTLWDISKGVKRVMALGGHDTFVTALESGQLDGKQYLFVGGDEGTIRQWDVRNGRLIHEFPLQHSEAVTALKFDIIHGQAVLTSGDVNGSVRIWWIGDNIEPRNYEVRGKHELAVTSLEIGQYYGEKVVISSSKDATVCLWSLSNGDLKIAIGLGSTITDCKVKNETEVAVSTYRGIQVIDLVGRNN